MPVSTQNMERKCFELLFPYLEPRFYPDSRPKKWAFNCWMYNTSAKNSIINLHFVNAERPRSPFSNLRRLVCDQLRAIRHAMDAHPESHTVRFTSWLNHVPRFLEFWPGSFENSRTDFAYIGGQGPGRWGQYMRHTGVFNRRAAEILRSTGRHRNPQSTATCPIDEAAEHLERLLAEL